MGVLWGSRTRVGWQVRVFGSTGIVDRTSNHPTVYLYGIFLCLGSCTYSPITCPWYWQVREWNIQSSHNWWLHPWLHYFWQYVSSIYKVTLETSISNPHVNDAPKGNPLYGPIISPNRSGYPIYNNDTLEGKLIYPEYYEVNYLEGWPTYYQYKVPLGLR